MQHRVKGRILSRKSGQRRALLKTLLGSLIVCEKITTTEAKAKEMQRFIDRLVNEGRHAHNDAGERQVVVRRLKTKLPAMAVTKLAGEFAERFGTRSSGFTRVMKLGRRKGDGARMAVIEFV